MITQNADINVGPAHYKDLAPDELLIISIFFTIQGEGPYAGKPAVFIRLAGCNRGTKIGMGCEFCDTAFQIGSARRMKIHEIEVAAVGEVMKVGRHYVDQLPMIVITGGEPMMQNNLVRLIAHLLRYGFPHVQIESNGDRIIPELCEPGIGWPLWAQLSLVVSPKQSRFTGEGYRYRKPDEKVWKHATALKFVISGDPRSPYFGVPYWANEFPREVYLSPMAEYREGVKPGEIASGWDHAMIDPELTKRNYQRAAKLAMETGFRVSIQQHLFLGLA